MFMSKSGKMISEASAGLGESHEHDEGENEGAEHEIPPTITIVSSRPGGLTPQGSERRERATRSPLLIRDPASFESGVPAGASEALVEFVDIMPTLVDLATGAVPDDEGRDLISGAE